MAEYIDKEFVIETIEELKSKALPKALLFDHLKKVIEIFPTEDFAPVKHGHWAKCFGSFRCSKCAHGFDYDRYLPFFNYCPCCGAKMDGGGEQ